MKLTEKQLKIQQRADKTLSFGCLYNRKFTVVNEKSITETINKICPIYPNDYTWFDESGNLWETSKDWGLYDNDKNDTIVEKEYFEIIGHPMNRGRLCWLHSEFESGKPVKVTKKLEKYYQAFYNMHRHFAENYHLYQQTVLERDEETQDMVIAFLDTLPQGK